MWDTLNEIGYAMHEQLVDVTLLTIQTYQSRSTDRQRWSVLPAETLRRLHREFADTGSVLNAKRLERAEKRIVANILQLAANTDLMDHGTLDVAVFLEENGLPEDATEGIEEWLVDDRGQWILSDHAMAPLWKLAVELQAADSDEDKLVLIDRILQITHQRSELAELFVEGGVRTLDEIFDDMSLPERFTDPDGVAMRL